jgi:hypothetical protein
MAKWGEEKIKGGYLPQKYPSTKKFREIENWA